MDTETNVMGDNLIMRVLIFVLWATLLNQTSHAADIMPIKPLDWTINAAGLITVAYDLTGDGKAELNLIMSPTHRFRSFVSPAGIRPLYPDSVMFFVRKKKEYFYFITGVFPLFYLYDIDADGETDIYFHDPKENGFE